MKIFTDKKCYLIIILLFIFQLIILSPINEFPLNDDWVHNWAINNYVSTGQFIYPSFLAPNMHFLMLVDFLLAKIFGFSFSLMRLANLLFALATILIFFKLLRYLKVPIVTSLLLSLTLWFNPIFFNLSYTSMGDIPTLFMLTFAILCFCIGFDKKNYWYIFGGAMLVILGFYIRQYAIFLLFAVGIFLIFKRKEYHLNKMAVALGLPSLILVSAYVIFYRLNWLPQEMNIHFFPSIYSKHIIISLWQYVLLFSLFLSPISFSILAKNMKLMLSKKNLFLASLLFFYFSLIGFILFIFNKITPKLASWGDHW